MNFCTILATSAIAATVIFSSCASSGQKPAAIDPIQAQIDSMTLREKVGQFFTIRPESLHQAPGDDKPAAPIAELDSLARAEFECYPCGGFCLFGANISDSVQVKEFTSVLHGLKYRPYLSIDEEGGRVARIGKNEAFDVPRFPNAGQMPKDEVYKAGRQTGTYLKRFGFDLDLAPVADVNTNPDNPVIGDRAFSPNPETAALAVTDFIRGLSEAGVASCMKHFPGHGDTKTDSHKGYAESLKTWEEISACEMIPFKAGIEAGVPAVMIAHISLPNVTSSGTPSTLSPLIIGKLRKELGFNGLIMTDSMGMKAVSSKHSPADAAVLAILAGVDVILTPNQYKDAFDGVVDAVSNGIISEERIDESVRRVLLFKEAIQ